MQKKDMGSIHLTPEDSSDLRVVILWKEGGDQARKEELWNQWDMRTSRQSIDYSRNLVTREKRAKVETQKRLKGMDSYSLCAMDFFLTYATLRKNHQIRIVSRKSA